ncbi:ATP-dependent nuclease [Acinetobacter gerneri]|uniref:ATP-dependent nuclease n=1 Tax=Acinetobacter gerneri TaxID=202952 RepID=UPI0023F4B2EC|nr:ATP-binding protein [Acinetobacter gerneri]MCH4243978.1 ATP-binding protein [Acinetobacter gerneri]
MHNLAEVTIKNFKSCQATFLRLEPFTALVGYNNAGKSNCLTAIQWLIRKSSFSEKDFYDESQPIEVIATIKGISNELLDLMPLNQKKSIEEQIVNGELKIRRLQEKPNAKVSEIKLSVWDSISNDWIPNPTGIDNAIMILLPEPIRIGAMENAAEDAAKSKTTTTIGKLLAEILAPLKATHEAELNQHLNEVESRISSEGSQRFGEIGLIDNGVNLKINDLFPGMSVRLHFDTPNIDDLIKAGTLKVFEGQGSGRDFQSYGHGAQRSIQIALIQYLAEIKRKSNNQLSTTLLLIDEPELYLHPFAIEQVRESLLTLSKNGYQIIISTHSAQMITAEGAETTLLIRKNANTGTYSRTRLVDAIQNVVPNSTHQMEQLFSLTHSTQLLFAENVILTEGKTEFRLLPFLFKNISGLTMGQEKHALVAQNGVNDTQKSLAILNEMDLPTKAICDLDYCFNGAITHNFLLVNDSDILALKGILQNISQAKGITINANTGLPQKNQNITVAKAYEILASETNAIPLIDSLHAKMKAQSIWIWKKGAIEAHLGTVSKTENEWLRFKQDVLNNGMSATCTDYQGVVDLVAWLRS